MESLIILQSMESLCRIRLRNFSLAIEYAYCIEPGVEINEKYYDIYTDWSAVDMSDELKSRL